MPTGRWSEPVVVMMATPVAKRPRVRRKAAESICNVLTVSPYDARLAPQRKTCGSQNQGCHCRQCKYDHWFAGDTTLTSRLIADLELLDVDAPGARACQAR